MPYPGLTLALLMSMYDNKQTQGLSCPICGRSGKNRGIERGKDYVIYRCSCCQGDFAATELLIAYQEAYKPGGDIIQDLYLLDALQSPEEHITTRVATLHRYALMQLTGRLVSGKLLDVGCGIGRFGKLAEERGFEVYAIDPAEEAVKYAKEKFGLRNAVVGTLEDIPSSWQNFDVIACFEVLEHVERPRELAKQIYKLLKPGGYLIMSVPNRNRLNVKLARREEFDYPPSHLTRWSKQVLSFFLNDLGFINIQVRPYVITRWQLAAILVPSNLNRKIVKKKVNGLAHQSQARPGFFLSSPIWGIIQKAGDAVALLLQAIIGHLYGHHLIAFAQKPRK